jgi:hypothetical protein
MKTYINLVALITATAEMQQAKTIELLNNSEHAEQVLRNHSTETRWKQYTTNQISREQAVEYATKRIIKQYENWKERQLAKLRTAENAQEITNFSVYVHWSRSRTWGYNPTATIYAEDTNGKTWTATGKASGYGYDKLSTAICEALNQIPGLLKDLYQIKENAIAEGMEPTAEFNESNKSYIAYGAGYGAIPYFEGGCGTSSTMECLEKCGFKVRLDNNDMLTGYKRGF